MKREIEGTESSITCEPSCGVSTSCVGSAGDVSARGPNSRQLEQRMAAQNPTAALLHVPSPAPSLSTN